MIAGECAACRSRALKTRRTAGRCSTSQDVIAPLSGVARHVVLATPMSSDRSDPEGKPASGQKPSWQDLLNGAGRTRSNTIDPLSAPLPNKIPLRTGGPAPDAARVEPQRPAARPADPPPPLPTGQTQVHGAPQASTSAQPQPAAPEPIDPALVNPSAIANAPADARPDPLSDGDRAALEREFNEHNVTPRRLVEAWLAAMVKFGASDLILRAGGRPSMRVDGRIGFMPGRVPGPGPLIEVLEAVVGRDRVQLWRDHGSVDAALQLDGLGRFRLNAYRQMGEPAIVLRRVSDKAPTLEGLELPTSDLERLSLRKRGLLLVTGIAGSGKSTTLAAMIQFMNNTAERHVITLEDPIEVLFTESRCVISQREVGIDCSSFHEGLRHSLRQSPDVILIGEMRDRETVSAALDATETGHLVMSTMHTVNAAQTLDRILAFYPAEQHKQIRTRLADNLAGVLSQRLLPRATGRGMVPAFELMTSTPRIRELLEKGETAEIARTIDQGGTPGLISFNQSLRRLVQVKLVGLKDALSASDRPDELVLALRGITAGTQSRANPHAKPAEE